GEPAEAFLWFARSMTQERNDPEIQLANRVRFRTWSRLLALPFRAWKHNGRIAQIAIRPGGTHLLAISNEGELTIWDVGSEKPIDWPGARQAVAAAAWTPNGDELVVGTEAGQVEIRGFPGGALESTFDFPGGLSTLAISVDGCWLALGGKNARI